MHLAFGIYADIFLNHGYLFLAWVEVAYKQKQVIFALFYVLDIQFIYFCCGISSLQTIMYIVHTTHLHS